MLVLLYRYQYNPNHIPTNAVYPTKKRIRNPIWDEKHPGYEIAIQPPTKNIGKTLILELENEEKERSSSFSHLSMNMTFYIIIYRVQSGRCAAGIMVFVTK